MKIESGPDGWYPSGGEEGHKGVPRAKRTDLEEVGVGGAAGGLHEAGEGHEHLTQHEVLPQVPAGNPPPLAAGGAGIRKQFGPFMA